MILASLLFLILATLNIAIYRQYKNVLPQASKIGLLILSVMYAILSGAYIFTIFDTNFSVSVLKLYGVILMSVSYMEIVVIKGLESDFPESNPKIGQIPILYLCLVLLAAGFGLFVIGSFETEDSAFQVNILMSTHVLAFLILSSFCLYIERKYRHLVHDRVDWSLVSLAILCSLLSSISLCTMSLSVVDILWIHIGGYLIALFAAIVAIMQFVLLQVEYPSIKSVAQYMVLGCSISLIILGAILTRVVMPQG